NPSGNSKSGTTFSKAVPLSKFPANYVTLGVTNQFNRNLDEDSPAEEGWMRGEKKKMRSNLVPRRRASLNSGRFGEIFRPEHFAGLTTPAFGHPSSARR